MNKISTGFLKSFFLIISCSTFFGIVPIIKLLLSIMLLILAKKELLPYLTSKIYYTLKQLKIVIKTYRWSLHGFFLKRIREYLILFRFLLVFPF